jgi:hypothetical protein
MVKKNATGRKRTVKKVARKAARKKTSIRTRRESVSMEGIAASNLSHALDPRLRRLACQAHEPARLRQDLSRGFITAADTLAESAPPAPTEVFKRVLVWLTQPEVPAEFNDFVWSRVVDRMFAATVPVSRLPELGRHPSVRYVEAGRVLTTTLDTSRAETRTNLAHTAPQNLRGAGVIVGVIDVGGLDWTLDDFRRPNGTTRVRFLWDQRLQPKPSEHSPQGFSFGVEYDAAAIDQALGQANPFLKVRHKPDAGSHATHVASTAAGNGRSKDAAFPINKFIGMAPEADIIFVEAGTEAGLSSFTDSVRVAEAVSYIFQRAEQLGRPCVINMSLGQNGGSHDGESVVERAIDRLLEPPGRAFVAAAGNEHIFRGHASGTLASGQSRTLRWKVGGGLPIPGVLPAGPAGDRTRNEMEVWYSSQDARDESRRSVGRARETWRDGRPDAHRRQSRVHRFRPIQSSQRRLTDLYRSQPLPRRRRPARGVEGATGRGCQPSWTL